MQIWKLAAAVALGGFVVASASAAPMTGLGQLENATSIEDAKGKGKGAARPRPGKCGVMKYYDRKTKQCASKG